MLSLLCVLMVQCADTGELATRVKTLEFHVGRLQSLPVPAALQEEKTARLARLRKSLAAGAEAVAPGPLPRAHAPTDYLHARPLPRALRHRICMRSTAVFPLPRPPPPTPSLLRLPLLSPTPTPRPSGN